MNQDKQEPCPKCLREASAKVDTKNMAVPHQGFMPRYRIRCKVCGIRTGWYIHEYEAWDSWNTRDTPDPVPIKIAELRARMTPCCKLGVDWYEISKAEFDLFVKGE